MKSLDVFLSRIMPQAVGCPDPLVKQHLVDAAIEFCERTNAVRHTTFQATTMADVPTYDLDIPAQTTVARVLKVWLDGRELSTQAMATNRHVSGYSLDSPAPAGAPWGVTVLEPNSISVNPPPATTGMKLVAHVALKPTRTATQLDDSLFERWLDGVVAATVVRICSTPGQPYTDPNQVMRYSTIFAQEVGQARLEANRMLLGGPLAVQPRPFV